MTPTPTPTPSAEKAQTQQIKLAAKMAGEWWAERLSSAHADKRKVFAAAVAKYCEAEMVSQTRPFCFLEVDYDPQGPLLAAVREVIDPQCRGFMFSARGLLPEKHTLQVEPRVLKPKEGYGNWTADIKVPEAP